ncbi:ABC transporter permease [Methylomarinum sp. Ch1-1]|uniref:ABC transporter permease n=1 Tax=Methylomarinum roseum TaxID=3067653 RepID=A0AAU7NZT4_9GAMM|nr:ABC transporter permease [Methylomarinum sp. Ch1-1]MDP4521836.1 ABC transporter permease [Methylomarinum sp. Ch1-1]
MIVLWTDALLFILVLMLLILGVYMSRKAHMRRPLRKIGRSKTGMAALVVLLFFLLIGLLDSLHFKDNGEVISVLDYLARPLQENSEKTYSAPFAAYLYSKETITQADGSTRWGYPRLRYGGAHLQDPEREKSGDIAAKGLVGFAKGAGLMLLFMLLLWSFFKDRHRHLLAHGSTRAVLTTLFLLVSGFYTLVYLSSYYHVLGTDKVGEDVFYQAIKSVRTGLVIGSLTTMIMLPLAILFGIMAGFFRGWVDDVIQYVYTTLNSIPSVLLIAASILMVQVYMANHPEEFNSLLVRADMRLLFLCLILGVTSWTGLCRMLRAETLKLREMEYVLAAQALGVTRSMILFRHILPNVMHIVLISVVLDFSSLVLAEAVLSYINIGVDPTTYSWGNMINGARLEMARDPIVWWSLAASFVFMFSLVLAANLFADSVRNAFDPRRAEHG